MDDTGANLVFGWRTALLGLASLQIALLAVALARAERNRPANRILAGLLAALIGVMTPYTIGFAGFYDRWPELSYTPFALTLLMGPLAWAYVVALTAGRAPRRLWLHLVPGGLQLLYGALMVLQPLSARNAWDEAVDHPLISPLVSVAVLAGLAAYSVAALARLRRYRRWLEDQRSDDSRYAARWLGRVLLAVLAVLAAWGGFWLWDLAVARLDYFGEFPLYLALAAIGGYLAVEGWRHAGRAFPAMPDEAAPALPPEGDLERWRRLGREWAERTRREGWAADPDLSLAGLAARLGTNTGYLSRAVNLGLGVNFSAFVNGLRCEAVAQALSEGRDGDLLDLALEAGFASKASFNRAFRAAYGVSPSAWRARSVSEAENIAPPPDVRRADD